MTFGTILQLTTYIRVNARHYLRQYIQSIMTVKTASLNYDLDVGSERCLAIVLENNKPNKRITQ